MRKCVKPLSIKCCSQTLEGILKYTGDRYETPWYQKLYLMCRIPKWKTFLDIYLIWFVLYHVDCIVSYRFSCWTSQICTSLKCVKLQILKLTIICLRNKLTWVYCEDKMCVLTIVLYSEFDDVLNKSYSWKPPADNVTYLL